MNELIKRINDLLQTFNESFKLKPNIEEIDNEQVATGFVIENINNDGRKFIDEFYDLFGQLISSSGEYELVYDEDKGFIIVKTVLKTTKSFESVF